MLVAHASQTGCAETLAGQTADSLRAGGLDVRVAALGQLDLARLRGYERVLFVASTYGEGDPPDAAAAFASLMQTAAAGAPQLSGLRYAVLALGDSEYAQFCGFGRALDEWLRAQGAQPLFDRVDVDNGDAAALRHWQHHLGLLAGRGDLPDWETPAYEPWRLQGRERLNPDSQGGLLPADAGATARRRARLAGRRHRRDRPAPRTRRGTAAAPRILDRLAARRRRAAIAGAPDARARWRPGPGQRLADPRGAAGRRDRSPAAVQPQFPRARRRPADDPDRQRHRPGRPARAAQARLAAGRHRNWLVFGERQAAHDWFCRAEIEGWRDAGQLERLDAVFSRDQEERRYVQHLLREQAHMVRAWTDAGAAVYVCGSLQGMAGGVDEALRDILGDARLQQLLHDGRYRRDVY